MRRLYFVAQQRTSHPMSLTITKTDIKEIDRQHRQLIQHLDELEQYAGGEYDFAVSLTAVTGLLDYTKEHFSFEENLMAQWGFPAQPEHKAAHDAFTAQVEMLWQEIESGAPVSVKLLSLIRQWIMNHINEEDALYAQFIADQRKT